MVTMENQIGNRGEKSNVFEYIGYCRQVNIAAQVNIQRFGSLTEHPNMLSKQS